MEEQLGLGQQLAGPAMGIRDVVAMLRQGVSPEELVAKGIPEELVMAAVAQLTKEATAVPREGLAGMVMQ